MQRADLLFSRQIPSLQAYRSGKKALQKKRYDDAIDHFRIAVSLRPSFTKAYCRLGDTYQAMGKIRHAIDEYQNAQKLDANNPLIKERINELTHIYNLALCGQAYFDLKLYQDAISTLTQASRLNPVDARIWNLLGCAYFSLEQYSDSIKHFNRAIELDGNHHEYYFRRGFAYYRLNNYEFAKKDCLKAIELALDIAAYHYNLGRLYFLKNEYLDSVVSYRRAIELNPNFTMYHADCAEAYLMNGDHYMAIDQIKKVIELDPNNSIYYAKFGKAYYRIEEYNKAIEFFNEAIELDPENDWYYVNRGMAYYKESNATAGYNNAISDFNQAIELNPLNKRAFACLVDVYSSMKNKEQALYYFLLAYPVNVSSSYFEDFHYRNKYGFGSSINSPFYGLKLHQIFNVIQHLPYETSMPLYKALANKDNRLRKEILKYADVCKIKHLDIMVQQSHKRTIGHLKIKNAARLIEQGRRNPNLDESGRPTSFFWGMPKDVCALIAARVLDSPDQESADNDAHRCWRNIRSF